VTDGERENKSEFLSARKRGGSFVYHRVRQKAAHSKEVIGQKKTDGLDLVPPIGNMGGTGPEERERDEKKANQKVHRA